jgi:RHS repeat-associated protein
MRPSLLQHPREFQAPVAGVPTTPTGYHQWHRSLSAELGRFGSRDPVGYTAGPNVYQYVAGDPTIRTDPSGLGAKTSICLAIVKALRGNTCNSLFAYCCHLKRHTGELGAKSGEICLLLHDAACVPGPASRVITKELLRGICEDLF